MSRLSELKGSHITPLAAVKERASLTVDIWGKEHSGKSDFALSAPQRNGHFYMTLEVDSVTDVAAKKKFEGRDIQIASYPSDIPAGVPRDDFEKVKSHFNAHRRRFAEDSAKAVKLGVSSVTWDKASQLWEVIRYGHFGRLAKVPQHLYGPPNAEFSDLVNLAPAAGVNLVLVNEEEPVWISVFDSQGKETRTDSGKVRRRGQDRIGQLVDVSLRAYKEGTPPKFFVEVRECRQRPELIGRVYENADFMTIAMEVKPDVDPALWV